MSSPKSSRGSSAKRERSPKKGSRSARTAGGRKASGSKKRAQGPVKKPVKTPVKKPVKKAAKKKPRELVSGREYGRRRGVAHTSVQGAIESKRLNKAVVVVNGRKMIDPVIADREWKRNTDQSKPRNSVTGKPKAKRRRGAPPTPMDLDSARGRTATGGAPGGNGEDKSNGEDHNYSESRARREAALAQIAELELEERLGLLVRARDVERAAFECGRKTRDQLIAMPDRISALLASVGKPQEIRAILDEEIEKICKEISGADAERS